MPGIRCAPSSPTLAWIYLLVGAAFIAYGVLVVNETSKVTEIESRYDYLDTCRAHWWGGSPCSIELNVTSDMSQPVFLYYSIKSMYQNNRYFSKSKDALQLMGDHRTKADVDKTCFPIITMKDLGMNKSLPIDPSDVASPCGLLPRAMFNDTFSLTRLDTGVSIPIKETGIAWRSDLRQKYEHGPDWTEKQWVDVEDGSNHAEHFMVWMGVAGLPHFRKLWGRIEESLPAGQYLLDIESSNDHPDYDTSRFGAEKWVLLSSTCVFGGRIMFLGIVYIAVGGVSVLGTFIICTAHCLKVRRLRSSAS